MASPIVFTAHSEKQSEIILSDSEITIAATGTQFGKSLAGTLWMQRQMSLFTEKTDNFLICAPSYKILNQSIIPYFLNYLGHLIVYSKADASFKTPAGGTGYFRTETDPDSIVGIPNVRAGWLDEAGKLRLYFWENYQARAAAKGARTLLTTSPYSLNWLYHDFIKPKSRGLLPEVKLIQAASWENPYHTLHDPVKREKQRESMDPRRFQMMFGGLWDRMTGLVYDCFDEQKHIIGPIQLPPGTRYFAGVDWGFTDPFVLLIRAITPEGNHYQISELYKRNLTITDQIALAKQKRALFPIEMFYCDPSQPGAIEEFNRNSLPAVPADNDIRRGIDLHYDLMKTSRFKFFRGSNPNTIDEVSNYHYPEEKEAKADANVKEAMPVDQYNHACDAMRYLTIMTYRTTNKLTPVASVEVQPKKRIGRPNFMKKSSQWQQTERWNKQ